MEPFLGMITAFGFNFAPRDWATCSGQLIQISQNQSLYSLLSTCYGGDGRQTFGLPDLRGRVIVGAGSGPGLSHYQLGQSWGTENTSLTTNNIPTHNHAATFANASVTIKANGDVGTSSTASARSNVLAGASTGAIYNNSTPEVVLNIGGGEITGDITVGDTGAGASFTNMQPYTTLNYCIATQGIYPPRS